MTTTQEPAPPPPTWHISAAVNASLDRVMADDPKVICLGEDIADPIGGVWKSFAGLSTRYGSQRVRNTPISEQAIVGAAIGASMAGYRVVAEIMFFDFVAVCLDQLANHAAKLRYMSGGVTSVPITICTSVGSGRFGAQHTQSLEAWLMHVPGIKVVYPSTPADAAGLMTTCVLDDDPCVFVQHSGIMFRRTPVPESSPPVPLGTSDVKREGSDVSIITYGSSVADALAAAEVVAGEGIGVEVVDLRSLVPLDTEGILASVAKTKRAIVLHAATEFCGPGAEIASIITENLFGELEAPVRRLGAEYVPVPFAVELDPFPTRDLVVESIRSVAASTGPRRG